MHDEQFRSHELVADRISDRFAGASVVGDGAGVSFGEAIRRGFGSLTVYGRASRSEYWYFQLFCVIINVSFLIVFVVQLNTPWIYNIEWCVVSILAMLVFVRRLHDVGRSGWWILLCITLIGAFPLLYWLLKKSDPRPNRFDLRRLDTLSPAVNGYGMTTSIEQVERLHRLRMEGAISDEEYQALKKKAL